VTSPATGGLAGRVALVTGGGRGIGRAVARAFAAEGAAVAVAARTPADVEAVAAECGEIARRHAVAAAGSEVARANAVDLTDEAAGTDVIRRVEKDLGPLDILVNNAGLSTSGKFIDTTTESWRAVMALDLDAPFFLTRAALPGMLARSRGAVINIASVAARAGFPYVAAYTAAKHGLLGLTRALAAEYAASGLTFNCVCPFYVDTPMTEETVDNIVRKTGRSRQEALAPLLTPQGRLVEPDEVAAVCVLLASDAGRSINGQAINVDGGRHQG
jgi:NAD(P)-dependent dehydrogenase (short-subunit alcohol dehydrogenase family)